MPSTGAPETTFREVRHFLSKHPAALGEERASLMRVLEAFARANEDPSTSENFANGGTDRWDEITRLLRDPLIEEDDPVLMLALKCFKILSRKHENRMTLGESGVSAVCRVLKKAYANPRVVAEAANVVLNVCYERPNVDLVIKCGGVPPLVKALCASDRDLAANAAGAIQSVCFQESGRAAVRETGTAIPSLVSLLASPTVKVRRQVETSIAAPNGPGADANGAGVMREVSLMADAIDGMLSATPAPQMAPAAAPPAPLPSAISAHDLGRMVGTSFGQENADDTDDDEDAALLQLTKDVSTLGRVALASLQQQVPPAL